MTITADDVRALSKAIAQANNHPDPDGYASDAVAHFNADAPAPAAQPAVAPAPAAPAEAQPAATPTV